MPRQFAPLFSPAALVRFLATAAVGLAADLYTKALAADRLANGEVVVAIRGWLQFEFVGNPGAVFGLAPGRRGVFLVVSVLAVAFLTYLFAMSAGRRAYQIILGLLLAGVLGNLYDRIRFGYVRDMIHGLPGWAWPDGVHRVVPKLPHDVFPYIFNVADTMLCCGVGVLLIGSFFAPREPGSSSAAPVVETV